MYVVNLNGHNNTAYFRECWPEHDVGFTQTPILILCMRMLKLST